MSKRPDSAYDLHMDLSVDEMVVVEQLMGQFLYSSVANLVRSALWSVADEAGIDIPEGAFDHRAHAVNGYAKCTNPDCHKGPRGDRDGRPRCRCSNLKRNRRNRVPLLEDGKKAPIIKRKPGARHPWREYRQPKEETTHACNSDSHDDTHGDNQAGAQAQTPE